MNDTIAKRYAALDVEPSADTRQRARVLARAVLRLNQHIDAYHAAFSSELAIAQAVIAEVPEGQEHDVALEHYRAQAAAPAPTLLDVERRLSRKPPVQPEYLWVRRDDTATHMCTTRAETVQLLAGFLDNNEGEARLMLDVAGARPLRCRGWIVTGAPGRG